MNWPRVALFLSISISIQTLHKAHADFGVLINMIAYLDHLYYGAATQSEHIAHNNVQSVCCIVG